jgi:hypothetical protein
MYIKIIKIEGRTRPMCQFEAKVVLDSGLEISVGNK